MESPPPLQMENNDQGNVLKMIRVVRKYPRFCIVTLVVDAVV